MASRTEKDRKGSQVEFISSHHPVIAPGDYSIQVAQKLKITAPDAVEEYYSGKARTFRIQAATGRFTPSQIKAVFPPEGSLGDHSLALPHVLLTPSTLPWQQSGATVADPGIPWLALLLFTDEEYLEVTTSTGTAGANPGEPPPAILEAPASLLKKMMPPKGALRWLTHVRRSADESGKTEGQELAVVMAHRLPAPGGNVAHLVAINGKYSGEDFLPPGTADREKVRLVTLKSWRFACIDSKRQFSTLLKGIDQNVFRHAGSAHPVADAYFRMGSTLLPHHMRQGNKSLSWYRGPLIPGYHAATGEIPLPVRSADELVRFDGLFDITYAAAWELGRLLMLSNRGVAFDLYHWKQANARKIKDLEQQIKHLPFDGPSADLSLPAHVVRWFEKTALLEGVPFHNLVPDEKLLPVESIRFFEVDWRWIECMLDGAFSIGRVTASDHLRDRTLQDAQPDRPHRRMSGFIMRSEVVSGWPDLRADGFDTVRPELAPETEPLFQLDPSAIEPLLSQAVTAADQSSVIQISEMFSAAGWPLSKQVSIDQRGWYLSEQEQPVLEMTRAANDKIDVRSFKPDGSLEFVGQIEENFAGDIQEGRFSKSLQRAFAALGISLKETFSVKGSRWFLSDNGAANYLIEQVGNVYQVYRDYRLPLLRFERLSANVLIGIFEGVIKVVDFHLKPEAIHHGVHESETGAYVKMLRGEDGLPEPGKQVDVPLSAPGLRIIDIPALAEKLAPSKETSEFALQMIEGAPKVRFLLGNPH